MSDGYVKSYQVKLLIRRPLSPTMSHPARGKVTLSISIFPLRYKRYMQTLENIEGINIPHQTDNRFE